MHNCSRPVLALDVDGVLSPIAQRRRDPLPRPVGWVHTTAAGYPFSFDPVLAAWLREMQGLGVELVWASDWGPFANDALAPLFEVQPFRALDIHQGRWQAVSTYASGRPVAWCEDQEQTPAVLAAVRAYRPAALLLQPARHLGLTAADRARLHAWLARWLEEE